MAIEKLAETLLEKLRFITQAETVIGQPIQAGESTVVPVSRVSVGFGFGGHAGKGDTSASGGGASVEPVAFLVIKGDDVRIMPITKDSSLVSKVMDKFWTVVNLNVGTRLQLGKLRRQGLYLAVCDVEVLELLQTTNLLWQ